MNLVKNNLIAKKKLNKIKAQPYKRKNKKEIFICNCDKSLSFHY